MWDLPKESGEYLSALHNLHSLTLHNITIEYISGRKAFNKCFSAFHNTLTELSLELFAISLQMFATVMDMVIFRTIFFELLVFFTFTLLTIHFAY